MIDSLHLECIQIGTKAKTKRELIKEIVALAAKSPLLLKINKGDIEEKLLQREKIASTGLSDGIAIPHCSFDNLHDFTTGLIISREGIDFNSIDGKKSNLIFFIIGAAKQRNKHIRTLSSISKLINDKEMVKKVKSTDNINSLYELLVNEEKKYKEVKTNVENCQFTIHIQNEELFNDILEVLSSEVEGAISVFETVNAGYYLNKLPLFSTFWNDSDKAFSRVIIAVVNKQLMNDTIRRINMVKDQNSKGFLLSVQDIIYLDGYIDF